MNDLTYEYTLIAPGATSALPVIRLTVLCTLLFLNRLNTTERVSIVFYSFIYLHLISCTIELLS